MNKPGTVPAHRAHSAAPGKATEPETQEGTGLSALSRELGFPQLPQRCRGSQGFLTAGLDLKTPTSPLPQSVLMQVGEGALCLP